MNKYEVFKEVDRFLPVIQRRRNFLKKQLHDEQDCIIHKVLDNVETLGDRDYHAYFDDLDDFTCLKIWVKVDKYSNLKLTCGIFQDELGNDRLYVDGIKSRLGDAFADALQNKYHTIVERIKESLSK